MGYELRLCLTLQSTALLQVADTYAVRLYALVVGQVGVYAVVLYDEHVALAPNRHMKFSAALRAVMLLSLIHISEPTRLHSLSRMPSSA